MTLLADSRHAAGSGPTAGTDMGMSADRRPQNEQARPPRTASCGSGGRALWEGWEREISFNNCLRLIVDDLAGSELGFELLNDLRMHLLIDLDLEPEHDEAEDDENKAGRRRRRS